jgi:putative endopeptidase
MRTAGVALLLAAGLVLIPWMTSERSGAVEPKPGSPSGITKAGFDPSVRPQDDLFRYVNGGWLAQAEIPAEYGVFGSFLELRDNALKDIRSIIEEIASRGDNAPGSEIRKLDDLYASFMDEKHVEELGLEPIKGQLARIDAMQDKAGFLRVLAEFQRDKVGGLFRVLVTTDAKQSDRNIIHLSQAGITLPDESFYREAKFQPIREAFLAHLARMFALAGRPEPAAAAREVMDLETHLAQSHWDRVKSRNRTLTYNKKDRTALDALTPGFNWTVYLDTLGAGPVKEVIVLQPDYFAAMARAYGEVPLNQWKTWLAWNVIHAAAPNLHKAMVDEWSAFDRKLSGATEIPPRWKRGVALVETALGEAAGKLYVARHFPPEAKARMQELVKNLIEAYRQDIENLDWMSPQTMRKALDKLAKFTPKIGYPDKWRDYTKLTIRRDDLMGNFRRAAAFEQDRQLAKLGKPVDRTEWVMTPQTVNAYYNASFNEIVFPAAILQPPFFDKTIDDAVNYGGIGAVIGHEIGHGFDDQGSKSDGDGNMKNWWTDSDRKEFEKRAKMLIDQYNGFEPAQLAGQHVNGALTIGENIGDLGGLAIAYKAYKLSLKGSEAPVLDGWTGQQRFFLGYGRIWRAKYRNAELMRRLTIDPHSPAEFRCNGVVQNLPEFYAAFNVKQGDKLWLPPDRRVRIW